MTDDEWAYVGEYVERLKDALGLHEYAVRIEREPPDADPEHDVALIDAQMYVYREAPIGRLRLHADFREGTPEDQRSTIVHELLHLPTDPVIVDVLEHVKQIASFEAGRVIDRQATWAYERMVERLAIAIAPLLPLPDWSQTVGSDNDANTPTS